MDPPAVVPSVRMCRRPAPARLGFAVLGLAGAFGGAVGTLGCGGPRAAVPAVAAPVHAATASNTAGAPPSDVTVTAATVRRAPGSEEHWYFEWLSRDGKRALIRRLDGNARSTLQTRVVDVDTGTTLEEASFLELAKMPFATIGSSQRDTASLAGMLASPDFGDDLVRVAKIASSFPFGSWGRFSAAEGGSAIAFNAGDWLYVSDRQGRVRRRLTPDAAYDPRFTPDGKYLLFRRATSTDHGHAKYELFVVPTDLSAPARALPGTAGARDRFCLDAEASVAVAVASHEPQIKTCAIAIGLKPPFAVKKLACLDGGEQLVESVLSTTGRYVALTTQTKHVPDERDPSDLHWRLRVVSTGNGKVVHDAPAEPGLLVRAVSDDGLLVQSGPAGTVVDDLRTNARRTLGPDVDVGHRGFFRSGSELVVVRGSNVGVLDVGRD